MIQAHIAALTTKFSEHRIDYTLLNTAEPLDRALFSYLVQPRAADEGAVIVESALQLRIVIAMAFLTPFSCSASARSPFRS